MKPTPFLTPGATCAATILLTLMLGVVDWASGYELQFFVFYFVPIAISAWLCGAIRAYAVAVLSAVVWFTADAFSGHPYPHWAYEIWNTVIRLFAFLSMAFTVSRIRDVLLEQYKMAEDLQKALLDVKTLTGLLPICAGCKKIRNDAGYWQQMEEYIEKHSNAQFTHGLCQECSAKLLAEAGIRIDVPEQSAGDSSSNDAKSGDHPSRQ